MGYKNLKNFKDIFNREDFDYISNINHIRQISDAILNHVSAPSKNDRGYILVLEDFLTCLDSFYQWLKGWNIPDLKEGYTVCRGELLRAIGLFKEPDSKRISISKGYLRKFNKLFLYGLSRSVSGIQAAFDPNVISSTNINKEQFERYFLDQKVGLRRKYAFNRIGKHAVATKIGSLTMDELVVTERLLVNPPCNQIRTTPTGWRDLGLGHVPVRILVIRRTLRKDIVVFLFRRGEHRDYQKQLATPPDETKLQAA